jgi:hypothetical protein
MLHSFKFAFRKFPDIQTRLSIIAEGDGHADMLQDLNDLAVLGKENIKPLQDISFDLNSLDEASKLSTELSKLLGLATAEKTNSGEAKKIRDKAYTYLKEVVDEIKDYGQFIFWKNDERLKGYKSSYIARKK